MIEFNFQNNTPKKKEDPLSFNLSLWQSTHIDKKICTYESIIK